MWSTQYNPLPSKAYGGPPWPAAPAQSIHINWYFSPGILCSGKAHQSWRPWCPWCCLRSCHHTHCSSWSSLHLTGEQTLLTVATSDSVTSSTPDCPSRTPLCTLCSVSEHLPLFLCSVLQSKSCLRSRSTSCTVPHTASAHSRHQHGEVH